MIIRLVNSWLAEEAIKNVGYDVLDYIREMLRFVFYALIFHAPSFLINNSILKFNSFNIILNYFDVNEY